MKNRNRRRQIDLTPSSPSVQGETIVPDSYRADALDHLCDRLAGGESLATICDDELMPAQQLVRRWLNNDPAFKMRYFDAMRVHALEEGQKLIAIADGEDRLISETVDPETGDVTQQYGREEVQRSRLRVDTRFKILSKLEPQIFGEKIEHDHNVVGELAQMMQEAMNHGHKLPSNLSSQESD